MPAPPAPARSALERKRPPGYPRPRLFSTEVVSRWWLVVGQPGSRVPTPESQQPTTNDQRLTTNDDSPCLSPTNSAAPSPTCGSPSPTAATTSASTAAPETKALSTATCPSPIICAWRECSSEWGLRSFV